MGITLTILEEILPFVSALLKTAIKNPAAYAKLKSVLTEIQTDLGTILAGM